MRGLKKKFLAHFRFRHGFPVWYENCCFKTERKNISCKRRYMKL
ncbi:hypothetical protein DCCM_2418 [Desulfocucumis palustris]|uniref:Uncharacterized protein n=1 Tax=Desulfocucumis palustris TaxID=1898651 RepID=A0A2L2XAM7_9FIRM|nr:hypothetical protein DCCM_2418 [Desulfocucumis palustris]